MLRHWTSLCAVLTLSLAVVEGCGSSNASSQAPSGVNGTGANGNGASPGGGNTGFGGGGSGNGATGVGATGIGGAGNGGFIGGFGNMGGTTMSMDAGGCEHVDSAGEQVQLDIYVMFDQSLSMNCVVSNTGTTTRWQAAQAALNGVVSDPGASGIGFGIGYFGQNPGDMGMPNLFSSCTVADYQTPDVEIGLLPGNSQALQSSFAAHQPATNTPTKAALNGAINHAIDYRNQHPGHTVIVVLVTDGQPNACGTVADVAAVAAAGLAQAQIKTFVVGIISSGGKDGGTAPTCNVDPAPPNEADLDTVAAAGGTNKAFMIDVSGNASQQFLDAMNNIRGSVKVPCEYQIPLPPTGSHFDPTKVNVAYKDPNGNPTTVYKVTKGTCDPSKGGWYYDDEAMPKSIILCTASCNTISTNVVTVNIQLGCQSLGPPA